MIIACEALTMLDFETNRSWQKKSAEYSIYSGACAIFWSMVDLKPPTMDDLIKIGFINKLFWISAGKSGNQQIEYRIPHYYVKLFEDIKNR